MIVVRMAWIRVIVVIEEIIAVYVVHPSVPVVIFIIAWSLTGIHPDVVTQIWVVCLHSVI